MLTNWRREIEIAKGTAEATTVGVLPQIVLRLRRQLGDGVEQRVRPNVLCNRTKNALATNIRSELFRKLATQLIAQLPERAHVLVQVGAHLIAEVDIVILMMLHPELAYKRLVTLLLPRPPCLARVKLLVVGLTEPVHVRLQCLPRDVAMEAAHDFVFVATILQVPSRDQMPCMRMRESSW